MHPSEAQLDTADRPGPETLDDEPPPPAPPERAPAPRAPTVTQLTLTPAGRWASYLIAGVVLVMALEAARDFLLPLVLGLLLAGVLSPVVAWMTERRVPRSVAAGLTVLATVAVLLLGTYYLSAPATAWLGKAPAALHKLEQAVREFRRPLEGVSHAVEQMRRLMHGSSAAVEVQAGTPVLDLLVLTEEAAVALSVTLILLFFLLQSGDFFSRQVLTWFADNGSRQQAAHCVRAIQEQVSVYLGTVTAINFCLGSAVSFVLWLLGVPNPVLWGVMFGALTFIPYVGPLFGLGVIGAVALVSADDLVTAVMAPLAVSGLSAIEGQLVTPVVLGRSLALNPVVIFVDLMFWTWLWGVPGAILAVPVLMAFKIVCDHVEPLAPIGRLLGRYDEGG